MRFFTVQSCVPAVLLSFFACLVSAAPPGAEELPFVLPFDDDSQAAANVSFLLDAPAGKAGFVRAEAGHFYTGGKRIRFWGTNVCFGACFPEPEDAPRIAGRLAKFGINCVRFHHMDSSPFPRGIFKTWSCEELSPEALARLDRFIFELKKRGIYVNLNLHVSRFWSKRHNWKNTDQLENYDKMVDIFYPGLIEAQKQYARDLLTHKNPHTALRYVDDPVVAMVEITNEDSLFMWSAPRVLPQLPQPYAGVLQTLWNKWLEKRYKTDAGLRNAWREGAKPLGDELLKDRGFATLLPVRKPEERRWKLEQHTGASMKAKVTDSAVTLLIEKVSGVSWHLQFKQEDLAVEKGSFYTVSFKAKAEKKKTVSLGVSQAHEPWGNLGLSRSVTLDSEWKTYVFGFTAGATDENARLSFSVGEDTTAVSFSEVSFRPGGQAGLGPGERLAAGSVVLYPETFSVTKARIRDRLYFYHDLEREYFTDMRDFLKNTLKVKAPVTGTIGFGALGTGVQAQLDFVDQHAYWQHPHFPRRPWDPRDWIVRNKAMSADPGGGTYSHLVETRVQGKPYTVTEYNHPAPMDSQAEMVPMIASFGALQDWDGIFLFTYNHSNDFDRTRYHGFFDIDANPAKMGFVPAGALLFSGEVLQPFSQRIIFRLPFSEALASAMMSERSLAPYLREKGIAWRTFLQNRWELAFTETGDAGARTTGAPEALPKVSWEPSETGRYIVDGKAAKVLCGRIAGDPVSMQDLTITTKAPQSASIVVASCDGKALRDSGNILITACGRCENTAMGWNEERTSVGNRWGEPPVRIEVVQSAFTLKTSRRDLRVFALDERGRVKSPVPAVAEGGQLRFTIGKEAPSLWYIIQGGWKSRN